MDYQLVVVRGRSTAQAIKLEDGVTTVGRQEGCQLKINSSQVSRKHCELFEKKGLLLVKDLGSSNGTFVNGKKIEGQRVLEPGNELGVGPVKFRVEKIGAVAKVGAGAGADDQATSGPKPGDTAIAQATVESPEPADEDVFELDFDDTVAEAVSGDPAAATPPAPPAAVVPSPEPKPEPKPEPAKPPAAKKAPPPPPEPEPEPELADEAVAEFLMDIELDEDDKR